MVKSVILNFRFIIGEAMSSIKSERCANREYDFGDNLHAPGAQSDDLSHHPRYFRQKLCYTDPKFVLESF